MKEQEIEKLADEYHAKHCLENKLPTDYYNWDSNKWIKQWWIDGYKAALSNPDYIFIEKEYIENRIKKLDEDKIELSTRVPKNYFNGIIKELKDILSNSKTK